MDIKQSFTNLVDTVVLFLPKLVGFLLILIIGYFIAKALEKILTKVLQKVGFDRAVERGGIKKALSAQGVRGSLDHRHRRGGRGRSQGPHPEHHGWPVLRFGIG